jgi:single-strand DNA-binding protein
MVQQTMFPEEIHTVAQPQRGAKSGRQPAAHNRPAQFQSARQPGPQTSLTSPSVLSSRQARPVRLSGRIGRYFDFKQTQTGKSLASFSLATVEPCRDESGNWAKRTVWQRVVAWDHTAQAVSQLLRQGARVAVEGKFRTREWTDRENNLHTTTELVAQQVQFLDAAAA